jgi:hypothetical protein
MITDNYRYIGDITQEEFETAPVLPFKSEDGKPCLMIRNSREKTTLQTGQTDNLEYHLNSTINKDGKSYCFHVISCLKDDGYSKEQFAIAYEYLFKKIRYPQSDVDLSKLISSLEQLFRVTPEADKKKLHIGVFGELLFLLYVYDNGYKEILTKYHSYFYSKHDIEIDGHNRIEIKSTTEPSRIHSFKHDQLFRQDINVYVGSLILEYSQEGTSLFTLFEKIMSLITDPDDLLAMGALKAMCDISEEKPGPAFSLERAISQIKIFKSDDLPHLTNGFVNGVSNISYDVDCALADDIPIKDFIRCLSSLTKK